MNVSYIFHFASALLYFVFHVFLKIMEKKLRKIIDKWFSEC